MYAYQTMASPLGPISFAENDQGIFIIHFGDVDAAFLSHIAHLTKRALSDFEKTGPHTAQLANELALYFSGQLKTFTTALSPYGTDFQRAVWQAIYEVPFGSLSTYGSLAQHIGKPKASRAVGGATGKNPIPIVIPCHRIVGSSGALTGFSAPGGLSTKIKLLQLEGIHYEL